MRSPKIAPFRDPSTCCRANRDTASYIFVDMLPIDQRVPFVALLNDLRLPQHAYYPHPNNVTTLYAYYSKWHDVWCSQAEFNNEELRNCFSALVNEHFTKEEQSKPFIAYVVPTLPPQPS